jgi:uncharacterized protein with FMN-binding domain
MAKKMPRRMVALSSSAIAAIYFAGFVATRAADAQLTPASSTAPTSGTPQSASPTASTAAPTPVVSASASPTATASPTGSGYADGTYTGTGTSRRGNVSVSVTVQSGRIANVTITSITTQYPVSRIASLPAQVVNRQSTQIDNISGATYSAQAFSTAVQQALVRATA